MTTHPKSDVEAAMTEERLSELEDIFFWCDAEFEHPEMNCYARVTTDELHKLVELARKGLSARASSEQSEKSVVPREGRKPRIGYVSWHEEEEGEDGFFSGEITGPQNPRGANLAWIDPVPFIEKFAYDELARENAEFKKLPDWWVDRAMKAEKERDELRWEVTELREKLNGAVKMLHDNGIFPDVDKLGGKETG
jgi:hypothetical protein